MKIEEQERVLENNKKNMLVSASAGSGKTFIMIKYICQLICKNKVPVKNFLVLTFTKAAATEMKERLQKALKEEQADDFIIEQLDSLSISNISTIHAFCEKCLKKYANLLSLNENFVIADENLAQKIRQDAFEIALKDFNNNQQEKYLQIMSSFKNDKKKIRDILFEIEKLVNSVADKELFLKENSENCEFYFKKATDFLFENARQNLLNSLEEVENLHVFDFETLLKNKMNPILHCNNIFEMAKEIEDFSFPFLPKRKEAGDEIVDKLSIIKSNINKILDRIASLNLQNEENIQFQRDGTLEKLILSLFCVYEKTEDEIKKIQNCLDFYDLEKYMSILSSKENLFDGISYVFVDEYQDTNKVQEKIVKNIAKNSNFVAVGDAKQGIYGFRLASAEIFLKDLESFEKDENSTVNYLKSNFRSSERVLSFVNDIFKVCMTKENCGIDYKQSSMLEGRKNFEKEDAFAVNVDFVKTKEKEIKILPNLYSVANDEPTINSFNLNLLMDIKRRINEVMSSKIYEDGEFRRCKYSDIAILSRKRDENFNQLELFLQENGMPVISNSRNSLLDEVEIKILLNYLKLALNPMDDIAMMSVLISGLGGFDIESLVDEKISNENSLCEIVFEDKNQKFVEFNKNFQEFCKDYVIFGIKNAFLRLFNKTNYRAYLNLKKQSANKFVDKFLETITTSGFEFDLPKLIDYLENVDISVTGEGTVFDEAVTLTTIHNSKGLEYPVVFLIGCEQSLKKSMPKVDVEINEEFGLALKFYDQGNNNEVVSVKMRAIQDSRAKKEFAEELMIFYVALTRAKNRLYLFGEQKDSQFKKYTLKDCDSYFDLILFALPQIKERLLNEDYFVDNDREFCVVEQVESVEIGEKQNLDFSKIDEKSRKNIENYVNFQYKYDDELNFKLKESVTELNNKNVDDILEKYSNENFKFCGKSVEVGNAYHLALKTLDFAKIKNLEDLKQEIALNKNVFDGILSNLDLEVLLKNILLLRSLTEGAKVYKEKTFIMKEKLCNLLNESFDDEILVQGIVDLFAVKDGKIVLIDYKYSNTSNDNYLIEKYKNQLKLYKIALENALKLPINDVFLLSLKNSKLIKLEF